MVEKLLKEFNLEKEVTDIIDCYINPPFNWKIWKSGIYKYNNSLHSYVAYEGQGLDEIVYNQSYEYIIELDEEIRNYFDTGFEELTEEEIAEAVECICENIIEEIKENEEN